MVSWHFGTATEPASELRSADESSTAAHSHCEPGPCLQEANVREVKMSKVSLINILYLWSF